MPRLPRGWHQQAGSMLPLGSPTYRATPVSPRAFWRQTPAELHASTPPFTVPASGQVIRTIGPQGMGERWIVRDVQVQTSSQYKMPPLVIQQVQAQQQGHTVTPPPPVVAEVWRAVATQREILLATTDHGHLVRRGAGGHGAGDHQGHENRARRVMGGDTHEHSNRSGRCSRRELSLLRVTRAGQLARPTNEGGR
jgi:hypothetical protein